MRVNISAKCFISIIRYLLYLDIKLGFFNRSGQKRVACNYVLVTYKMYQQYSISGQSFDLK